MTTATPDRSRTETRAQRLAKQQGWTWRGHFGQGPCPCCQTEGRKDQTALSVWDGDDGQLKFFCKKAECDFRDIRSALRLAPDTDSRRQQAADPAAIERREAEDRAEAVKKARVACRVFREGQPLPGTGSETYIRGARGIAGPLPSTDTLRHHRAALHGPTGLRRSALIAKIEGGGMFAIHRTFLQHDGSAKAEFEPNRLCLGPTGGGAVRLWPGARPLLAVAEGIEDALSLRSGGYVPDDAAVWAATSASAMRVVRLPDEPGHLIVAIDNDDPDRYGRRAGEDAGKALARRARDLGWRVRMIRPPVEYKDFNDLLTGKTRGQG